jgi:hypothetical protein
MNKLYRYRLDGVEIPQLIVYDVTGEDGEGCYYKHPDYESPLWSSKCYHNKLERAKNNTDFYYSTDHHLSEEEFKQLKIKVLEKRAEFYMERANAYKKLAEKFESLKENMK